MIANRFRPLRVITTKIVENADGKLEQHLFCIRFYSHQQLTAKFCAGQWACRGELPVDWDDAIFFSKEIDFEIERSLTLSRRNDHDISAEPQARRVHQDRRGD